MQSWTNTCHFVSTSDRVAFSGIAPAAGAWYGGYWGVEVWYDGARLSSSSDTAPGALLTSRPGAVVSVWLDPAWRCLLIGPFPGECLFAASYGGAAAAVDVG